MRTKSPNPNRPESRTKDSLGWVVLPGGGRDGDPPPTPGWSGWGVDDEGDRRWATKYWKWIWGTPMATMYGEGDTHVLARLVAITAMARAGGSGAIMAEIRQLEDRFGLNPKARRALYWRIEGVDTTSTDPAVLTHSDVTEIPSAGGARDPRLRLVGGTDVS